MKHILQNRLLQHIAFWLFYILIYTCNYVQEDRYLENFYATLIYMPLHMAFVYTQLYVLVPRLMMKQKIFLYVLSTLLLLRLLLIANVTFCMPVAERLRYNKPFQFDWNCVIGFDFHMFKTVFAYLMLGGMAIAIKFFKSWMAEKENNWKIENEKSKIELELLKAQVHPHFLFNTLNNLYALTLTRSRNAPLVVTHLSDLLRYMLYECNSNEVAFDKEIHIMKKYVELEKLRYGDRIDIAFNCSGNTSSLLISPLLLLPLIENSFKHGSSQQCNDSWINVHIHAQNETVTFNLSNSYDEPDLKAAHGGIGLQNVKKRLQLLYPGKHELKISSESGIYSLILIIKLKKNYEQTTVIHKPHFAEINLQ